MSKAKTYYMHTINGKPAFFWDNTQICHMARNGPANPLATSLRQIRRERERTIAFREESLGIKDSPRKYGYRRVCIPPHTIGDR